MCQVLNLSLSPSVPSNSRVLMLFGQLEKMNRESMLVDPETARQITAKILHLIQTQGEKSFSLLYTTPFTLTEPS